MTYEFLSSSDSVQVINQKKQIAIPVAKIWDDSNNQDGIRPESVTIKLFADSEDTGKTLVLTEATNWSGSFSGLYEFSAGKKIIYTIAEVGTAFGYTVEITGQAENGFVVTNTHPAAKTSIPVAKAWEDNDNFLNKRPESVTIELLADGTPTGKTLNLTESNNWSGSFEDLDEFIDGRKIIYTVSEAAVDSYTSVISGSAEKGFIVVNCIVCIDQPEKPPAPETGDEFEIYPWIFSMLLSTGIILLLSIRKLRNSKNQKIQ